MKKNLIVRLDDPCHEDWDKMTPKEQGRYCNSCAKTVIDFSGWSDTRVSNFMKENKGKDLCGNFLTDQLNRPIANSYQESNGFSLKAVLLGASLTSLLSLESCRTSKRTVGKFYSEERVETIGNSSRIEKHASTTRNQFSASKLAMIVVGTVLDLDSEKPMSNVDVKVFFTHTTEPTVLSSNRNGQFKFEIHDEQSVDRIEIQKSGFIQTIMSYDEFETAGRVVRLSNEEPKEMLRGKVKVN